MYYYKYDEFLTDVANIYNQILPYSPDTILAIARGGVTFGHFLSEKLGIRNLVTLNAIHYDDQQKLDTIEISNIPQLSDGAKVLIVDDIVDSGESMRAILDTLQRKFPQTTFKTCAIYYKEDAIFIPDYKAKLAHDWIEFFWSTA